MSKIEILAPSGSFSSLNAAINAGADAVYFGIGQLNMRSSGAQNFSINDLLTITTLCKKNKIKTYLTLNTVVYDNEIEQIVDILLEAKKTGVDAIIASDFAVIQMARKIGICVHISTQMSVSNIESVKFLSQYTDRIVLARELNLDQIKFIVDGIKNEKIIGPSGDLIEIEVFAHGAMCVAVSGRCSMSLCNNNKSANRGQCVQVCRRKFKVIDQDSNQELLIDNNYVMSASDLCTIDILDKIINTGVVCLKIEGRGRPAEYVDTVVRVYKKALEYIEKSIYTEDNKEKLYEELKNVYNRGLSTGFYLGLSSDSWANTSDNKSPVSKTRVGKVVKYYQKINIAQVQIFDKVEVKQGDNIIITGDTTGIVRSTLSEIKKDDISVNSVFQGDIFTFKTTQKVRKNDTVFIIA